MGADFAYVGSAFIATPEARASDEYKAAIVSSSAADIVYSDLFTGIHGNYLRASIVAAGLDPENLPAPGADAMNFQSATGAKAWRDIWGSGQGVGAVDAVMAAGELVAKMAEEYAAAKARVCAS
jgi:nitronate monooxygenase